MAAIDGPPHALAALNHAVLRLKASMAAALRDQGREQDLAAQGFAGAATKVPYRAEMEASFGTSLDGVQAHVGPQASAACNEMGAEAYAYGNRVAFRDASPSRQTVAHEITHVVQQTPSVAGKGGPRGEAAAEAEATRVEAAVTSGRPAREVLQGAQAAPAVRLKAAPQQAKPEDTAVEVKIEYIQPGVNGGQRVVFAMPAEVVQGSLATYQHEGAMPKPGYVAEVRGRVGYANFGKIEPGGTLRVFLRKFAGSLEQATERYNAIPKQTGEKADKEREENYKTSTHRPHKH